MIITLRPHVQIVNRNGSRQAANARFYGLGLVKGHPVVKTVVCCSETRVCVEIPGESYFPGHAHRHGCEHPPRKLALTALHTSSRAPGPGPDRLPDPALRFCLRLAINMTSLQQEKWDCKSVVTMMQSLLFHVFTRWTAPESQRLIRLRKFYSSFIYSYRNQLSVCIIKKIFFVVLVLK